MIVFYNGNSNKLIGTVKKVGERLVADVDSLKEFESYTESGIEIFFNQFSDWSNGYTYSFEIKDDETPEPVREAILPEKTVWTATEIQEAYRKQRESDGSVNNA